MKIRWQIFWHVLFWTLIIAFLGYVIQSNTKMGGDYMLIMLLFGLVDIGIFYLNYLLLIPKFLNRKKYGQYALAIVAALAAFGIGKYGLALIFKQYVLVYNGNQTISAGNFFISTSCTNLIFLFLSVVLKFTVDWFLNERVQRDLENQRLSAELAFLKSQINPHFLFNSLNSIYSLAYQRSETTPEAILKLSEIMRYMLYECNDNKVDLAKELQYLQNYIDLQKIRFSNVAYIDFKVDGVIQAQQIVPLLLIAFIENAFKHGVANDPLTPIRLLIDVDERHLHFYIQNKKHNNNRDAAGGIGLNNVKRRLNLLYPSKYNLDIRDEANTYTVELSLVL